MKNGENFLFPHKNIGIVYSVPSFWIGLIGLCLIGALWFVALQLVEQDRDDEINSIFRIQSGIAKAMEVHALDILNDADSVLLLMKQLYETQGAIPAELRKSLKLANFSRFTAQASVIGPQGDFIFSFREDTRGANLADRPQFLAHVGQDSGTRFIGPVQMGRVSGQSSFHMSRRINNPDGSLRGVASLAMGTDYFTDTFSRISPEKMHFILFGKDGIIRATDTESSGLLGKSLAGGPVFRAMEKAPTEGSYLTETIYTKTRRFISYRAVEGYPLVIGVSVDEAVALARYYERRKIFFGTAAFFSVILFAMMVLITRILKKQEYLGRISLEEKERAEQYLAIAGSMIVALDRNGRITLINQYGCTVLGREEAELLGKEWFETAIPTEYREQTREKFQMVVNGNALLDQNLTDRDVINKENEQRIISWKNSLLRDQQGNIAGILASGIDVTERRRMELALRQMATTDSLTGLCNRRSFLEKGQHEFEVFRRYQRPLSLLLLDIDHFKQVNDTYGHAAGDQVLVQLAQICRESLRSADICGRFGGEEFICLLPNTAADKAFDVAERLRRALAEKTVISEAAEIHFTVSIGVTTAKPEDESIEELIRLADANMYVAKQTGRNRVVAG